MAGKKTKPEPSDMAVAAAEDNRINQVFGNLPMLRELGQARLILDEWLEEFEGEETPELADLFARLEGETHEKVERWGLYLQDREAKAAILKADEDFYAAEAKRLKERREAYEKGTERSRAQLQFQMELQGIEKVEGTYCTVQLQANPPKLVGEVDAEVLATWFQGTDETFNNFVRYTPESFALDRAAIKTAVMNRLIERLPAGLEMVQARRVVLK